MTRHPEEGTLHAYIDGQLVPAEAAALEAHVATCAQCSAALAEARGLVAASSRAISALDSAPVSTAPSRSAGVAAPAAVPRVAKRGIKHVPFARAAALLLLAGGTAVVVGKSGTLDGEKSSPVAAVAADGATGEERAMVAAPTGVIEGAPVNPAPAPAGRDLSAGTSSSQGAAVRKTAPSVRGSALAANDAALEGQRAASPAAASPRAATGDQLGRVGASPTIATAFPASPPAAATAPAARLERAAEATVLSTANLSATRVTRLRTRGGVVLTLTDEPLRTSFAEEAAAASRRPAPGVAAPMSAQMTAPVVNSFRWSNPGEGRTFTLTGPLPVTELEAASKRLAELERVP